MALISGNTSSNTTITGTYVKVPTGTTAQRNASGNTVGMLRYNTDPGCGLENYTANGWLNVSVQTPNITSVSGNVYYGQVNTLTLKIGRAHV